MTDDQQKPRISPPPLNETAAYAGGALETATVESTPLRIGPYQILETLGEGGMGVVCLAEQKEPVRRRVALKLIKLGMDTKDVIARFESERQALALMSHPNVASVLDAGYWCGMTLYPVSKCTPQRGVDMIEMYGDERITVNSAGDWGPSNPLAVRDFIVEMRSRGHAESKIKKVVYDNPLRFFAQCPRFSFTPRDAEAEVGA